MKGNRHRVAAYALIVLVPAGLVLALAVPALLPLIVIGLFVGLDLLGAVYGVLAGRGIRRAGASPLSWYLVAAGRGSSVLSSVFLMADAAGLGGGWWWAGTVARYGMFVLITAGVLAAGLRQFQGRSRHALIAELVIVVAAGFMTVWYLVLSPILAQEAPSTDWVLTVGWPIGDLMLLAAVASVVLRGAVTRFAGPIAVFTAGLVVYVGADVARLALTSAERTGPLASAIACGIVLGALLLTLAPMLAAAAPGLMYHGRTGNQPAWSTHLPMVTMVISCLVLLLVTLLEQQFLPWGGLIAGLTVMTAAAAARQILSLRESRDQVVTDGLTGLANRAGLDQAFDAARRRGERCALLLVDLDGFKLVNDAYGHAAGDLLLTEFARLLRGSLRAGHTAARIGGDEFAVLLPGVQRPENATAIAERILQAAAAHPVALDADLVPMRASIGVALAGPGDDGKVLLRHADVAMYHSKGAGSHGHVLYHPGLVDRRAADAAFADDLERALSRGELFLLYQPLVDLASGRPSAVEALIRWQHPVHGTISPVRFIPIAERTGAITAIGLWVLAEALGQLPVLRERFGPDLHVSVNLSPRQLREPAIVHDILTVLARAGAAPSAVVLEVTESALVDEHSGIAELRRLREAGVRIAIDDFGTGYSSLQYLTRLPVDILKIDRSFVAELNGGQEGAAVTGAILRLAQVLHLGTVAEGIETEEQASELRALGCDTGQGYLYARPATVGELVALPPERTQERR